MTDSNPSGPDGPVPVALALLDQRWPPSPALTDSSSVATVAGPDRPARRCRTLGAASPGADLGDGT